jgi:hypothetical protein
MDLSVKRKESRSKSMDSEESLEWIDNAMPKLLGKFLIA